MPRGPKFPGLQPKFEQALQKILADAPRSGGEIHAQLKAHADEFGLSVAELTDLGKNFANYVARAKEAGIIQSGGPWAGYQLVRAQARNAQPTGSDVSPPSERSWRPTEAAGHFVATCGLSLHFGALVHSLPTFVDSVTWGNADMMMLRGNPSRQRLEDSQLDPDLLALADSSPPCVLTSIEMKYGLERNRKTWFQAVAEAAANSRWANESLLVHVASEPQTAPLDDEIVSLARSAEVGIVELTIGPRDNARRSIETRVILQPPQRPFLRLAELSGNRIGLLREAHSLLALWKNDVVTFLDEEGAAGKLLALLRKAIDNLCRQAGFSGPSLDGCLRPLLGDERIRDLYAAALDTIAAGTDTATDFSAAASSLSDAAMMLSKRDYDAFLSQKDALVRFAFGGKGA